MPVRLAQLAWLAWVAFVALVTAKIFNWHLEYFRSPGPEFYRIALVAVPAFAAFAWLYALVRRSALRRYEPAALAIFAALVCAIYEPRATAVVALLFLACSATGRFALAAAGIKLASPLDRLCLGFGAGAGILILALTAAGLARLLLPGVCAALVVLPPAVFWRQVKGIAADLRALHLRWTSSDSAAHPLTGIAISFGAVALVVTLLLALAPSIAFDAVAFHLPLAEYYATTHTLQPVPGISYSYYPQGVEMLWTTAYLLGGQPAAQMVSLLFLPMFAMVLLGLARECSLHPGPAVAGVVFAITMPFVHWSGSVMKNDLALGFFEGLALYAFLRWLAIRDFQWIAASAFFLAQAFGVKYIALFAAIPLALFYAYAVWREERRWKAAVLCCALLLPGAFWMARAYWLTGNPVAPSTLHQAVERPRGAPGTIPMRGPARLLQVPAEILFHGERSFESPLPNPAGIALFALAPLALLGIRTRPKLRAGIACAIFTAVYLLYWGAILQMVRYAILPFALIAIFLAARAWSFYDRQGRVVRISVAALATYCLLIAMMGLAIIGVNAPQFSYFAGKLDKLGYLRASMQAYGAVDYLRLRGDTQARVYGIENQARAYSANPSNFDAMWCSVRNGCDAARVLAAVRAFRADYLILPVERRVPESVLENLGNPPCVYNDSYFRIFALNGFDFTK